MALQRRRVIVIERLAAAYRSGVSASGKNIRQRKYRAINGSGGTANCGAYGESGCHQPCATGA